MYCAQTHLTRKTHAGTKGNLGGIAENVNTDDDDLWLETDMTPEFWGGALSVALEWESEKQRWMVR